MQLYGANFYLEFHAQSPEIARQVAELIAKVHINASGSLGSHLCEGTLLPVDEPIDGEIVISVGQA